MNKKQVMYLVALAVLPVLLSVAVCVGVSSIVMRCVGGNVRLFDTVSPPAQPPELTITRFYSDVDGREISDTLVQHYDGSKVRDYSGAVIVRKLGNDKWLVRVIVRGLVIQEDGSGREEVVERVELEVKEKVEMQVYFDPCGEADTPGAIRS